MTSRRRLVATNRAATDGKRDKAAGVRASAGHNGLQSQDCVCPGRPLSDSASGLAAEPALRFRWRCQLVEHHRIVGAHDGRVEPAVVVKLAQAGGVFSAGPVVERDYALKDPQAGRSQGWIDELLVVKEGVAGVQDPAGWTAHGDAAVAAGMSEERHQRYVGVEAVEARHGVQSQDLIACVRVGAPARPMVKLLSQVAKALGSRGILHGPIVLGAVQVNGRIGKVGESAGVVQVQVSHHDVAHVRRGQAETLDLANGGLLGIEHGAGEGAEGPGKSHRAAYLAQPKPGVDEDQAVALGLEQQAVTYHAPGLKPGRAAE